MIQTCFGRLLITIISVWAGEALNWWEEGMCTRCMSKFITQGQIMWQNDWIYGGVIKLARCICDY